MFQTGFQSIAFQGVWGGQRQSGGITKYTYVPAYQLDQIRQQEKAKKTKTEIQKLESVLREYQRRQELAEESLRIAEQSEIARLTSVQNELMNEINRLLKIKAELMARLRREEEILMLFILKRRRLRAF